MPTSTLTYVTEDPRNGWVKAREDEAFPSEDRIGAVEYGYDSGMVTRGLVTGDLADLDTPITPGATITAVRFVGLPQTNPCPITATRVRVGLGDPWSGTTLQTWQAIAAGTLDQTLSAAEMDALLDGGGLLTLPLAAAGIANMQAALEGAGLFWLGLQTDEATTPELWNFFNEDPAPLLEIDWSTEPDPEPEDPLTAMRPAPLSRRSRLRRSGA